MFLISKTSLSLIWHCNSVQSLHFSDLYDHIHNLVFLAGGSSDGASGSGSSPKPVASIAIKRKADVEDKGKEGEAKKVKEGGDSVAA